MGNEFEWPLWFTLGGKATVETMNGWLITMHLLLCFFACVGYAVISHDWWGRANSTRNRDRRRASLELLFIFILSGIALLLMPIIRAFIPAWLIQEIFLFLLVIVLFMYTYKIPQRSKDFRRQERVDNIFTTQGLSPQEILDRVTNELKDHISWTTPAAR